jgi:hypothetical protein
MCSMSRRSGGVRQKGGVGVDKGSGNDAYRAKCVSVSQGSQCQWGRDGLLKVASIVPYICCTFRAFYVPI